MEKRLWCNRTTNWQNMNGSSGKIMIDFSFEAGIISKYFNFRKNILCSRLIVFTLETLLLTNTTSCPIFLFPSIISYLVQPIGNIYNPISVPCCPIARGPPFHESSFVHHHHHAQEKWERLGGLCFPSTKLISLRRLSRSRWGCFPFKMTHISLQRYLPLKDKNLVATQLRLSRKQVLF